MIVADTNIIAYFFIKGDYTQRVKSVFRKDSHWASPVLWRSEFRNILSLYVRNKQMDLDHALILIKEAEFLMKENEYSVPSAAVLKLAESTDCLAYDCEFIVLAKQLMVPLITVDKKLLNTFATITLSPEEYIQDTG